MVSYPQKVDALTRILEVENFEGMIVFVRTKSETETLAEKLRARGFSAAAINGDVAQAQRERTVNQLKSGKLDILVATDVAARGLDVERISHVVNYDIPTDTESYVHRIGRTGRAGRSGDAISLRDAARALPAQARSRRPPASRSPRCSCRPPTTSTRPGCPASTTRSPRRSSRPTRIDRFRDIIAALRARPRRAGGRRRRRARRRRPGRHPAADRPRRGRRASSSATTVRTAATAPTAVAAPSAASAVRAVAPTSRWRRTGSRSASATRSSRARSSARSPTRAACRREDFGHIDIRARPLAGRAAGRPAGRRLGQAQGHPDLRQAHRAGPGRRRAASARRGPEPKKPRHKDR